MNLDVLKALSNENLLLGEQNHYELYCSTGSLALNWVISGKYNNGGIPIGGITEIMGESSSGKTVIATHILIEAQKNGWYTILLDNEFSFKPEFATTLGLDIDKLVYDTPDSVPGCFWQLEKIVELIRRQDPDTPIVAVIDSMAGQGGVESEATLDKSSPMDGAIRAKEIGQILRKFNPKLRKNRVGLVVINQTRTNVGVTFGDPTTRSGGGNSLFFYCACSLRTVSSTKASKNHVRDDNKNIIGISGKVVNQKNKISIPFKECPFELIYDKGLTRLYGLREALIEAGVFTQAGAWLSFTETNEKVSSGKLPEFIEKTESLQRLLGLNKNKTEGKVTNSGAPAV